MIGIIGAMEVEVKALVSEMSETDEFLWAGRQYYRGKICGVDCVVASSGEGKVNSAVCTQVMIDRFNPDLIINTGVAGGIGDGIEIGDIVFASSTVEYDYDVTALGKEVGYVYGIDRVYVPTDEIVTKELGNIAKSQGLNAYFGVIASGDKFVNSDELRKFISSTFNAKACEMEGASIGHTCCLNDIPFCVLRAISDNGNENAKVDFPTFVKQVVPKTTAVLMAYLENIAKVGGYRL